MSPNLCLQTFEWILLHSIRKPLSYRIYVALLFGPRCQVKLLFYSVMSFFTWKWGFSDKWVIIWVKIYMISNLNKILMSSVLYHHGTAKCAKNGNSRKPVGIVLFRLKTAYFNVSDDSGRCALILPKNRVSSSLPLKAYIQECMYLNF